MSEFLLSMRAIKRRSSGAVRRVYVSLKDASVTVVFKCGSTYDYVGVSRRAILNLMLNDNMSLGFWVNKNCVNPSGRVVDCYAWTTFSVA